ncbi:MAG: DUF1573 domain-containing protein [Bacteroidetes bacterium]|nr:DUF1573 domain-containing protein [Bacteroidota bacterium]
MRTAFKLSLVLCLIAFVFSCKQRKANNDIASGSVQNNEIPQVRFESDMHDFGEVVEGEKVSFSYKFTNLGKGPLIIKSVASSCGCTVGEYTKDTIKPGGQGDVTVSFDSWHRVGFQQKSVTVNMNTNPPSAILRFKARVIAATQNVN